MSVPFKSKLSYAWARATRKNQIYSHVFKDSVSVPLYSEVLESLRAPYNTQLPISSGNFQSGSVRASRHQWLEAKPVEGSADQFVVSRCSYQQHGFGGFRWYNRSFKEPGKGGYEYTTRYREWASEPTRKYEETVLPGVHTQAQAKEIIKDWEAAKIKANLSPLPKQPFKKRIKTSLTA